MNGINIKPKKSDNDKLRDIEPLLTGDELYLENKVAPDALPLIPKIATNAARWNEHDEYNEASWNQFISELKSNGLNIYTEKSRRSVFVTDGGGYAYGMPGGVLRPNPNNPAQDISQALKAAQKHNVPVTVRGGGLSTEGESVAYGGLLIDLTSVNQLLNIDKVDLTARVGAGIFWHKLGEELRGHGLDYISAPLNMTSTVGGVIAVGGVDINSPKFGTSADQVLSMKVVTPKGEILECNESENSELFDLMLYGYGQFGVAVEVTLKIREFTPIKMHYFYYSSLEKAIDDLQYIAQKNCSDYCGILTMMDKAINLLVAFDSEEKEKEFFDLHKPKLSGFSEMTFALRSAVFYMFRPWRFKELMFLINRRLTLFPDLMRKEFMSEGKIIDRAVMFSQAVWRHWGGQKMVIPDLSAPTAKFKVAVLEANKVCKKNFKYYTLYCVAIKRSPEKEGAYEFSCMPKECGDDNLAWGCEFEPMTKGYDFSRDHIQSFKNEIYDIGADMDLNYYRFGGMMKGYIMSALGEDVFMKYLKLKKEADPNMVLNRDVVF